MTCSICGHHEARIRYMTRSYGKGATLLIIENVPAEVDGSA
ncbi:MAG TPA: YgiT-type zinc finger protein [Thermoanaerobaculia bacterium]|nr:YgiT-type zinc finger protein [Thermoanaerobaculia bacterium]